MNDKKTHDGLLVFGEKTVIKAGSILMAFKDKYSVEKTKDIQELDIATSADYASEAYIVDEIKKAFPLHNILSEEKLSINSKSDYEWVIDPLDGTKEYIRNIPYYYVLMALEHKHKLTYGFAYQPELKRLFSSSSELGQSYLNGKSIRVSPQSELAKSFVMMAMPNKKMPLEECDRYLNLMKVLTYESYRIRTTPWDIEALFNVAMGSIEAHVVPISPVECFYKWWDIAPGILGIEMAGGKVTDFYGNPFNKNDLTKGLVASNGKIHQNLLDLLKKY